MSELDVELIVAIDVFLEHVISIEESGRHSPSHIPTRPAPALWVLRFVQEHDDDAITAKLNQVYSAEESALDSILQTIQSRSVRRKDS